MTGAELMAFLSDLSPTQRAMFERLSWGMAHDRLRHLHQRLDRGGWDAVELFFRSEDARGLDQWLRKRSLTLVVSSKEATA